ncbi:hypothetical protein [Paraflavitalea speifideaquila]|uniref:hypothetical protein n=1 Tax=Paraflavitalea speifideaquila TaxID=3076558 RepID=UPI0028F04CB8|nr:hypothetical protein [Paraflavitalea speifideiaquila]
MRYGFSKIALGGSRTIGSATVASTKITDQITENAMKKNNLIGQPYKTGGHSLAAGFYDYKKRYTTKTKKPPKF